MVTVNLEDINDNAPVFEGDSLLAAVAEEAELDTTVTVIQVSISCTLPTPPITCSSFYASSILQAHDRDSSVNYSTVFYEIIAVNPPFVVDRDTGAVVTAGIFRGRSGEIDRFTVRAYDNMGEIPSLSATAILSVSREDFAHNNRQVSFAVRLEDSFPLTPSNLFSSSQLTNLV